MAENDTPKDKAAAAAGADAADMDEGTNSDAAPVPPAPAPDRAPKDEPEDKPEDKPDEDKPDEDKDEPPADNEAKEEDTPDEEQPLDTEVWGDTGDEVGNSVLGLLQNAGMEVPDAKAILYDAVQAGDITKVDKDALIEKVGKDKATLILAGTENYIARSKAKAEAIVKDVHTAVGGEDNWNTVTKWAQKNVSAEEIAEYRELIDAGGAKARFAAKELVSKYNEDSKNTTIDMGTTEITPDGAPPVSARAITKAQYVKEIAEAYDNGATPAVIAEIRAVRKRGRNKGL